MNPNQLRAFSSLGIVLALGLCVLYVIRTHQAGETKWYFLVMAMGILLMMVYGVMSKSKRKKK